MDVKKALNDIKESIEILNEWKKKIEKKIEQTQEDLDERKIIDELMSKEMERLNNLFTESNKEKQKPLSTEPEEEGFESLRDEVDRIEKESKKLQPKIEGEDLKRKDEILIENGFVETLSADGRKRLIHSSLVGKYFDLVKELRRLQKEKTKEYVKEQEAEKRAAKERKAKEKEEAAQKAKQEKEDKAKQEQEKLKRRKEELEEEVDKVLKGTGKKDRIKYKGKTYVVPTNRKGYFTKLLNELNQVKETLGIPVDDSKDEAPTNSQASNTPSFDEKEPDKTIPNNEESDTSTDIPSDDKDKNNQPSFMAGIINQVKETLNEGQTPDEEEPEEGYLDEPDDDFAQESEDGRVLPKGQTPDEEEPEEGYLDEPDDDFAYESKDGRVLRKEKEDGRIIDRTTPEKKLPGIRRVRGVRKPKFIEKIIETVKKRKKAVIAASLALIVALGFGAIRISDSSKKKSTTPTNTPSTTSTNTPSTTPTNTPSTTPTNTPSTTPTNTPSTTPTNTPSTTPTNTPSTTSTNTPSTTPTNTPSTTPTNTPSTTSTNTPSTTSTNTPSTTPTNTPSTTSTNTPSTTSTNTPSTTPTNTPSTTSTNTPSTTPTNTPSATSTNAPSTTATSNTDAVIIDTDVPITEVDIPTDILRQAIIQSGGKEHKSESEDGPSVGITDKNLEWWIDQGKVLTFKSVPNSDRMIALETQKNIGVKIPMGFWPQEDVENYVGYLSEELDMDFDVLYKELTGKSYINTVTRGGR